MSNEGIIEPINIKSLKPFPLPKYLEALPPSVLEEFAQSYDLIKGYIKQLETYKTFSDEKIKSLDHQIKQLNEIIGLFADYESTSSKIKEQINSIQSLYSEFSNLETYQYQLLSSNYGSEALKYKYKRLINDNNTESINIAKKINQTPNSSFDGEFNRLLTSFKESRMSYHLRKEKLNRWNEERVAGFI